MENNRTEFLQELEAELASLKEKVLALEDKLEAFRALPVEESLEESDFTDMEIGVPDLPEPVPAPAPVVEEVPVQTEIEPVAEPVPEPEEMDLPIEDLPEPEPELEPVQVNEIPDQVGNDGKEPEAEAEPALEPEPQPEPVPEPEPEPVPVVPHPETERLPWRMDKPGLSVKNIRSGISLYDRALFIGTLFKEDYALYDKTIGDLNAMSDLDQAVDYLLARFPDWNLKSDIVYNFMMAVRKKLG